MHTHTHTGLNILGGTGLARRVIACLDVRSNDAGVCVCVCFGVITAAAHTVDCDEVVCARLPLNPYNTLLNPQPPARPPNQPNPTQPNQPGDLVVSKGDQYDVREREGERGVRSLGKPVELTARC
jgi:hypothetical protein